MKNLLHQFWMSLTANLILLFLFVLVSISCLTYSSYRSDIIKAGEMKNVNILRAKSVMETSAQTINLCAPTGVECSDLERKLACVMVNPSLSDSLKAFIYVQFSAGLRVSEVINIKPYDILYNGMIRIRSSKGSISRIIHCVDSFGYIESCRLLNREPFSLFSRFFVYREYKKLGLVISIPGSSRNSVTHAPRHLIAQLIQGRFADKLITADFLRHKNLKSTDYYI